MIQKEDRFVNLLPKDVTGGLFSFQYLLDNKLFHSSTNQLTEIDQEMGEKAKIPHESAVPAPPLLRHLHHLRPGMC